MEVTFAIDLRYCARQQFKQVQSQFLQLSYQRMLRYQICMVLNLLLGKRHWQEPSQFLHQV